jgi:hypothetical protein
VTAPSSPAWGPKRVNYAGPRPNLNPRSTTQFASVMVLIACLVYAVALPLAIASGDFDLWGGFLVAPVLVVIGTPMIRRFSRGEEVWIQRLMVAALYTKLLGAGLRYFVTFSVLGAGDARAYHLSGAAISKEFRGFNFGGTVYQEEIPKLVGTSFIKLLTGILYMFTPAAEMSGFMMRSGSPSPTGSTVGTQCSCSSCRRSSSGPRASARKRGCCSRSASLPTARHGCSPTSVSASPSPRSACGPPRWCART